MELLDEDWDVTPRAVSATHMPGVPLKDTRLREKLGRQSTRLFSVGPSSLLGEVLGFGLSACFGYNPVTSSVKSAD